ncbi:MAG TPA: TonB-dependent receptor [Mucilaginibacter sp.]
MKLKQRICSSALAFFTFFHLFGNAQTLDEKFEPGRGFIGVEKVYLQFDKPYYAIGDTIYFKAYITFGAENKLSALSGILHAELVSQDNKVFKALNLMITAGTAHGDFTLSDGLKKGNYYVRAYTNWMRNEGNNALFERMISIGDGGLKSTFEDGNLLKIKNKVSTQMNTKIDVQFFPEGGQLVTGNYSKMAFKILGQDGLGKKAEGVVTDENGVEVLKFHTGHAGMGSFNLVPKKGKTYKAIINFSDGSTKTIALPKANDQGYTFSLNNNDADTIRIRIAGGCNSPVQELKLIAQACGKIYYAVENISDNKYFSIAIPKSKFPSGIIEFTLQSPTGEPLIERLAFIEHPVSLKLNLNAQKQKYAIREKVKFTLDAKNNNKPSVGSYSVAVIDEDKVTTDTLNESTIMTSLLLTADLKGYIEQPGYYFSHQTEETRTDLDNLLLTQGYRYFTWKQIADTTVPKYQPEKAINISGTVKRGNKPIAGAEVKLFSNAGGMFMLDTITDMKGRFEFAGLIFPDSTKFVIQSKVKKAQDNVTLQLDTPALVYMPIMPVPEEIKSSNEANLAVYVLKARQFYGEQKKYGINQRPQMLNEIKIEARKETSVIPHSQNLNGAGAADHILTSKDIERFICGRLSDCLQGVFGLHFVNGSPTGGALIIDGTFVDLDTFATLQADDIEGIEILRPGSHYAAIYGSRMANGGIIVTTKRAKKQNQYYRYAPGVITYMPKGFYKAREFYSPQYDNPHTNQKMADLRSTIYWNPNIITDKDGKASFSYFNADGKGTYRVVIEGIDADGNLGRQVLRYKVE